jgi:hypothetical protein
VIEVALLTVKLVAGKPPKLTSVAPSKFAPVMVTVVPPEVGPEAGLTDVTIGEPAWTIAAPVEVRATRVLPFGEITSCPNPDSPAGRGSDAHDRNRVVFSSWIEVPERVKPTVPVWLRAIPPPPLATLPN